jgi:predicted Zn-dependent protease
MMKKRDIFIASQTGVNPLYNKWASEAISEWMDMFSQYKNSYPIQDIKNYRERDYIISDRQYATMSSQDKSNCVKLNGQYLAPYKSIDWYVAHSVIEGMNKGFRNNQICSDDFINSIKEDPYSSRLPQLSINIVKNDLKPNEDGPDFIFGHSVPGKGCVVSVARMETMPLEIRKEFFKTILMHEFTHVCSLTGNHCGNKDCIMKEWNADILKARLQNKAKGKPPLCDVCHALSNAFFAKDSGDKNKMIEAKKLYDYTTSRRV